MKNVPSRAAGEAMPSLTRRLFLRGAAIAAPLAALPALAASAERDPLIALIHCYRQQMALYNTSALSLSPDEDDAFALRTWRPPYDLLCESPPAATSLAGVQEAVRFVIDEEINCGGQEDLTVNVLKAALAYFDGSASL